MKPYRPIVMRSAVWLVSLSILTFAACQPKTDSVAATPLKAAPAWKLTNLEGQTVNSSEFKGKVVVIDFWATWCPPCRAEIPGYVALQEKYGKDGLAIVGISLDNQGPEVVKQFVAKNKMNYTVVMGDESVVAAFGGVDSIPTTFIVDRQGNIRDQKVGAVERAAFEQRLLPWLK